MNNQVKIYVGEEAAKGKVYLRLDPSLGFWTIKFENGTCLSDVLDMPRLTELLKHPHLKFKTTYTEDQLRSVDETWYHTNHILCEVVNASYLNRDLHMFPSVESDLESLIDKIKKESISRVRLILGIKDETENDAEIESEK